MNIVKTKLPDCVIIEPSVFGDERGFFLETFQVSRYSDLAGITLSFVQDNHSRSSKRVLRGLHFQKTKPQGKLVRVVRGEVFDVAVDIRKGSPNFGEHVAVELSEKNKKQLLIPKGFAHGFIVLSDEAISLYVDFPLYKIFATSQRSSRASISDGVHKSFKKFLTSLSVLSEFSAVINFINAILYVLAC